MRNARLIGVAAGILVLMLAVVPTIAACAPAGPTAEKPVVWRFNDMHPAESRRGEATQHFCDQVKAKSNGRLVIEPYFSLSLGFKTGEVFSALKEGAIELSSLAGAMASGHEVAFGAGDLPFLRLSAEDYLKYVDNSLMPRLEPILEEKWNIKIIATFCAPPADIYTNIPIKSLDDFKELKVRTAGGPLVDWVKAMGSDPIYVGVEDLYTALQRHMVDAAITSLMSASELKFWEVLKYRNSFEYTIGAMYIGMNKSAFDALPKDVQKVVIEAGQELATEEREILESDVAGMLKMLTDHGMIDNKIPDSVLKVCRERATFMWSDWAKSAGPFGEEMLKEILKQ